MTDNFDLPFPELYPFIRQIVNPGTRVYLVGGCVRDILIGKQPDDLDFAVSGEVKKISRSIANQFGGAVYSLDDIRQTMRVLVGKDEFNWKLDIALLRGNSLHDDLGSRDFTINAMALEILGDGEVNLIDPLDGQVALAHKIIDICSPDSIINDPIRILRAERIALQFGFTLTDETVRQMQLAAASMINISGERQRDELFKLLETNNAAEGLNFFLEIGVFQPCLPLFLPENLALVTALSMLLDCQITEPIDQYISTALAEERSVKALLFMSSLINPQPEAVDSLVSYYALSNRERTFLTQLATGKDYLRVFDRAKSCLTPREIYQFYKKTHIAGVGSCLVALADPEAGAGEEVLHQLITAYFEEFDRYINVSPLLNGNDLLRKFHLAPGPLFKELLEALKEAQAMGDVTSKSQAERFIELQLK